MNLFEYDDEYQTNINKYELQQMVDDFFPIPAEDNMYFSDCLFNSCYDTMFDSEDVLSW